MSFTYGFTGDIFEGKMHFRGQNLLMFHAANYLPCCCLLCCLILSKILYLSLAMTIDSKDKCVVAGKIWSKQQHAEVPCSVPEVAVKFFFSLLKFFSCKSVRLSMTSFIIVNVPSPSLLFLTCFISTALQNIYNIVTVVQ